MRELHNIRLTATPNATAFDGLTVLEAVALLAGEPHSDTPDCVCPVLAEFVRILGGAMPDAARSGLLVPLVPALCNTRDPGSEGVNALVATDGERQRARLLVMWAINSIAPRVLSAAGLYAHVSAFASTTVPGIPDHFATAHAAATQADRPENEMQFLAALASASEAICYAQAYRASYCVAHAVVHGASALWHVSLAESLDGLALPVPANQVAWAKVDHVWIDAVQVCRAAAELGGNART